MNVVYLRGYLNTLPHDTEVFIQLPDTEPPVDFVMEFYGDSGKVYRQDEDVSEPGTLIIMPVPPVANAVWDIDNNVISWYSLDSDAANLTGGEG